MCGCKFLGVSDHPVLLRYYRKIWRNVKITPDLLTYESGYLLDIKTVIQSYCNVRCVMSFVICSPNGLQSITDESDQQQQKKNFLNLKGYAG
ncbi:hypothetical protein CEXT_568821 [Caerostris extrusa]|uniref:Uncharacterized protein n=1 Tax=Caerostris extrusa TaxID=172846 RepID=A0AAV4Y771_CAEEX|nr:hypothetical protein CEXT_568821 [Caerostris extrusa]